MKLTHTQIQQIDQQLIAYGFRFIDIRIEVLDHVLCLIEEKENLDFEQVTQDVFEECAVYLTSQKRMQWNRVLNQRIPIIRDLFLNPVFFVLWLLCFVIYRILPYSNHTELLSDLDILPLSIPIISYSIFIVYLFKSTNKVTGTFGVFFSISFILMFYLYVGIHMVRILEPSLSIIILSGFTAISLMLYYLFFYYKIKNEKKFKKLLNS